MFLSRIDILREKALDYEYCPCEFRYKFYKNYTDEKDYGEAFYSALSGLSTGISDGELIVGKISDYNADCMTNAEKREWEEIYSIKFQKTFDKIAVGQDSHMSIDYELLLNEGIYGIIKKIDTYISSGKNIDFYETCKKCLEGVIAHSQNYSKHALSMAEQETNEERKKELIKISEITARVPAYPAESFYEAVQSVSFITYCLSLNPFRSGPQQFQLGHPDRYLWNFYEKDLKSGKITKEYAQLLLDCLGIQINMRVPNGLSSGYMVGGRDENNNIVQNELTLMCMQVVEDVKLVYPSVGLCYTQGMDEDMLKKACEILSHGLSHPAIFNDDIISKGLRYYGVPDKEAHNYIHSTCVEITPAASSNVWVASPYTNMPKILLDCLDREYDSFDELIRCIFAKLDKYIKDNFEESQTHRKIRKENSINPLLSCFVNDCLKEGVDIEKGGARYNWTMPSFVGMANLVDSLYVIKKVVFDNREYTIAHIAKILNENFEGNEPLRNRFLNTISKYGNDNDEIDKYFKMIIDHITEECTKYNGMFKNSRLIPSVFCWIMHEQFGRDTGATPDGRAAGFPLGDGSGPCQGREKNGPTASINSSTKWEHYKLIGGVAVNLKFAKASLNLNAMENIIKTYMERGGFEIQINVTDNEILKDAVKHPEKYGDLVVRIGGYSDYFTRLSKEMQQEVILRTEHK